MDEPYAQEAALPTLRTEWGAREGRLFRDGLMELSTKGRYAVMALADLAKYGGADAIPLSAVAERQQLSIAYLEQIFGRLRRAGLVDSVRGRAGGYCLMRPANEITVIEILRAVDEGTRMTRCTDGPDGGCLGEARCLTHELWHAMGAHIAAFLSVVTLQEVVDGIPEEKLAQPVLAKSVAAAE
ncbi:MULTISPECIES: Rrf2 family transcriptional regulator [Filomicrobium]|uniref:Transcriptional regulator, BadM/Rrf2 family n=1 Tax=Filomicrobium insigne TaxID=418854 RepID=A0A1H0LGR9_9HYPH|nr:MULTISPECIES: Rrf2 family transcriptional regulator [Filomicrobium]SDO67110.1 transcriptional regulator, BadM/Rrf2 family [Filomicrobium insigne]